MPSMKSDILNLGQLLEKVYDIYLKNYSVFLWNNRGNLIMKVKILKNRMFSLNILNDIIKYLKACHKDPTYNWHFRYRHINFGGLKLLLKKNMVKDLSSMNHLNQLCEECLLGKQFRKSFLKKSNWRAQKPLELIHTNMCRLIKLRLEVFEAFKKFKVIMGKESGH